MQDALELLESGDWEAAHKIVQDDKSLEGSWAHGIVHLMEGDLANAGYWYDQAGRHRPDAKDVQEEIAALKNQIG